MLIRGVQTSGSLTASELSSHWGTRLQKIAWSKSVYLILVVIKLHENAIRGLVSKDNPSTSVTTTEILHWAIHETWNDNSNTSSFTTLPRQIRERCDNLGVLSLHDVHMDEEQERPPDVFPERHFLHPDVVQFVKTGVVPSPSQRALCHVFTTGAAAGSSDLHTWSPYVLAIADSCKTIQESESVKGEVNPYLRPVRQFEVDRLMPEIRISEHLHLHLYIPRTTKRMKPADDLRLHTVPPLPSDWIPPWDLIDHIHRTAVSKRLHIPRQRDVPQNVDAVVLRSCVEIKDRFKGTPLPLALHLLAVRTGMDFARTDMGRILDGWALTREDLRSRILTSSL
ncbi:hypothetical protein EV363DRAFT_1417598 [Boletus edulis]|nr:hypothetical protein EV363DRAFT_1417598 [Boletus edulis]